MKVFIVLLAVAAFCMAAKVPILSNAPAAGNNGNLDVASSRIISGRPARPNHFPHQVLLLSVSPSGSTSACGASLISASWVLSAAQCTSGVNHQYNMRFGSNYYHSGGIMRTADRVVNHPQFNFPHRLNNDISVLHIPTPVAFSDAIRPTLLPTFNQQNFWFGGFTAQLAGWGALANGGFLTENLRWTTVLVQGNRFCTPHFGYEMVIDTNLCSNGLINNEGPCDGDFGGALALNKPDEPEFIQIGIASFVADDRMGGCQANIPTVYTRVSRYLFWIRDITGLPIRGAPL